MQQAAEDAAQAGYRLLRLDTDVSRPALRELYRSFGFQGVDIREVEGYLVERFELAVAPAQP
ncbi:hypothetical protein ACFP81_01490 [Deinococcus lacus]|uniref:N-acetyltransferase domain-containing protein n=1 Tax=Deinococcus lacus TaxID=392561 RepID=A0ABW1Y942_9DEIO